MFKPSMFKHGLFKHGLSKRCSLRTVAIVLVGLCTLLGATTVLSQPPKDDPLPAGEAKEKAASACLACHGARIIVQQRLSKAAWAKEVDKMTKWGAEVDPKDREALIDYLSANFGPDQVPYQAPTSAQESKSRTPTRH
jgi:mono/diheme cytochrome c family protein